MASSNLSRVLSGMAETTITATDQVILVDPDTRQLNIPGIELVFGVEGDASSERKYFQFPRYVGDNLDLSGSFLRVNYRNANGDKDFYLVDDVAVDGDFVVFSWKIHPKVVAYKGQVRFVVCVVGPDLKVKWHTTLGVGISSEGLEPDAEIEAATEDGVAALIAMVEQQTTAVENVGAEWVRNVQNEGTNQILAVQTAAEAAEAASVAEIEAKGVNTRNSIPEDYTALSEAVNSIVRGKAPGIVCSVEGSAIAVNDASDMAIQGLRIFGRSTQDGTPTPDAPVEIVSVVEPVVTVCGKNLFNLGTFSGTQSSWNEVNFPAGEYTFSAIATSNDTDSSTCLVLIYEDRKKLVEKRFQRGVRDSLTFTVTGTLTHIILYASNTNSNSAGDAFEFADTMLEIGSEATVYEPYKAIQTVELTHTLPGIPVTSGGNYTDNDGQQWVCDEVDLERGVYVQRVNRLTISPTNPKTFIGSDNFIYYPMANYGVYGTHVYCSHYENIGFNSSGASVKFDGFATVDEFNTFVTDNSVYVVYVLATPIETTLSETEIAAYRALHSNYPNTTILNDAGAHMVVKYAADTKLYIDNKIAALVSGV